VEAILGWCTRTFAHHGFDGVTISGGEPFEQPAALLALLQGLDTWRRVNAFEFDILCYSGWPLTKLRKRHVEILQLLDLLIPEPFVNKLPNALTWRGSSNQPLVPLSERGAAIARETVDAPPNKRFQLDVCNGSIWFIGVPDRGDLQRLEDIASRRGVALSGVSWRV
jgi:anaerobic ribonucleoside-triphosphate reductase activating protein